MRGVTILRQDKEGWTYGITECGDLFVGYVGDWSDQTMYLKDTAENRTQAESYWKAMSFAKEVKVERSEQGVKQKKLKELKKGEWFTLKPIEEPTESQVYIKGEYDRTDKKYECGKWNDVYNTRWLKGDKTVYVDFIF